MSDKTLPETVADWNAKATYKGLKGKIDNNGIQTLAELPKISASRITLRYFLVLRCVWQSYPAKDFNIRTWLTQKSWEAAKDLTKQDFWTQYIGRVANNGTKGPELPAPNIELLSLLHFHQAQVFCLAEGDFREVLKVAYSPRPGYYQKSSEKDEVVGQELPNPFLATGSPVKFNRSQPGPAVKKADAPSTRNVPVTRSQSQTAQLVTQMRSATLQGSPPQFNVTSAQPLTPVPPTPSTPSMDTISPLDPSFTRAANDEQIVNMALLLLLNGICISNPGVRAGWSPERRAFHITSLLEARTDGYLRQTEHDFPLAILEVKSYVRRKYPREVRMQESAEMAAWIAQIPDKGHLPLTQGQRRTRLIIAQDHQEVYLILAVYPKEYVDYVGGKTVVLDEEGNGPSLTMHEFGPWLMSDPVSMNHLGPIILAFAIMQS